MKQTDFFLETAHRIGARLCRQALWHGDTCNWLVYLPDKSRPGAREGCYEPGGSALYQGTSGIALFLAELYRWTQDPALKKTAEGALAHAFSSVETLKDTHFGFYTGRVGIAYAAMRAGQVFEEERYLAMALRLLAPLAGREAEDQGLDVIGGAAGAIPALLIMAETCERPDLMDMAVALGENLIRHARRAPIGWSWGGPFSQTHSRDLLGLAHGAAGYGHALLELYAATGANRYLYAAEQAFLYERQFFDERTLNWPDFRHVKISEYIADNRIDALKDAYRAQEIQPYQLHYMSAWCHGAPGIGLSRLRAFEILKDPCYEAEARAALTSTLHSLFLSEQNYSLCHGHGGNSETLLYAAEVLGDPRLRQPVEECALAGIDRYEKADEHWPCGTIKQASDPSLMLGEAGIGWFYLRLYSTQTPSILLLQAPQQADDKDDSQDDTFSALYHHYVNTYFGSTRSVLQAVNRKQPDVLTRPSFKIGARTSDIQRSMEVFTQQVEDVQEPHDRALLDDILALERDSYLLSLSFTDATKELLDALIFPAWEALSLEEASFRLSDRAKLVSTHYDWDQRVDALEAQARRSLEPAAFYYLLYRTGYTVHRRKVGQFSAFLLQALEASSTLPTLCELVGGAVGASQPRDHAWLRTRVVEQLKQLFDLGILECSVMAQEPIEA